MKHYHGLSLLTLVLSIFLLSSCGDDDDINIGIGPDTRKAITGYWQVGGQDLNNDAAITGMVVHDDGTVTEWQYADGAAAPFSLGYKTSRWTVSGKHYELQLSKGNGTFYTVVVAGNDDNEMYLAYNGKTSVVPMRRLRSLPGDGNNIIWSLENMKFSNFSISDFTGYWEYAEDDSNSGIYIDRRGNLSNISTLYPTESYKKVNYHSDKLPLTPSTCSFPFRGAPYTVYAVGRDTMLASVDGHKIESFVRKDTPKEIIDLDNIFNTAVSSALVGTWEATHYTQVNNGYTSIDEDITATNSWSMQLYQKLVFTADHKVRRYTYYNSNNYIELYFSYDANVIKMSSEPGGLVAPEHWTEDIWQVQSFSDTELKLSNQREIYTFKKTN